VIIVPLGTSVPARTCPFLGGTEVPVRFSAPCDNLQSIERRETSACVIAHPAHELCVFHWLERAAPTVFVLTDGSGGSAASRVGASRELLASIGASPGALFGELTDRQAYALMMRRDVQGLHRLVGELADALDRLAPDVVAGDALEGYNPVHDLCRVLIDSVCELLDITDPKRNLAFSLTGVLESTPESLMVRLDDAGLARKLAAARAYAAVEADVERMIDAAGGIEGFRVEVLQPQCGRQWRPAVFPPYYETFGRQRIREGVYREALTYDHFRAAADVIGDYVTTHR
jgi:hypothetical protein